LIASGKHAHFQPSKHTPHPWVTSAPPGDVRRLLADKVSSGGDISVNGVPYTVKKVGSSPALTDINLEGVTYAVKMADLTTYHVSSTSHSDMTGALVDWGANGGIAGSDCHIIEVNNQPQHFVNVEGIDRHVMTKWWLVTTGALLRWTADQSFWSWTNMHTQEKDTPSIRCLNWNGIKLTLMTNPDELVKKKIYPNPWWFQHTYEHSTWIAIHWYVTIQRWWVGRTQQSSSHFSHPRCWLGL
jgi:hypothetical protein